MRELDEIQNARKDIGTVTDETLKGFANIMRMLEFASCAAECSATDNFRQNYSSLINELKEGSPETVKRVYDANPTLRKYLMS
jgi:hypothetical protein